MVSMAGHHKGSNFSLQTKHGIMPAVCQKTGQMKQRWRLIPWRGKLIPRFLKEF